MHMQICTGTCVAALATTAVVGLSAGGLNDANRLFVLFGGCQNAHRQGIDIEIPPTLPLHHSTTTPPRL
jgi:hypothetical protein